MICNALNQRGGIFANFHLPFRVPFMAYSRSATTMSLVRC